MRPDDWHLTEDVHDFLARAGDFLRSRPVLHTMPLTVIERLRTDGAAAHGAEAPVFGRLERGGEVHATFYQRTPSGPLSLTSVTREQADVLAARLVDLGHPVPGVSGDHDSATSFAEAWQRHTGAVPVLDKRLHLYRLGALTPPEPLPEGRGRVAGEQDHEQVVRWCREFCVDVGESVSVEAMDAGSWADTRFADKHFTFWETPDGTPVSMAGSTSMVGGMIRVDPVYTPAHLRGRGYAGAVTVEVSRAALAAGATDVVLFTDPANPTSNALYRRLGYVLVTDFAVYGFSHDVPEAGWEHDRHGTRLPSGTDPSAPRHRLQQGGGEHLLTVAGAEPTVAHTPGHAPGAAGRSFSGQESRQRLRALPWKPGRVPGGRLPVERTPARCPGAASARASVRVRGRGGRRRRRGRCRCGLAWGHGVPCHPRPGAVRHTGWVGQW
ncbi:hypothetical protein GCM10010405_05300 [Streptomyces macrosporus]|uniref:N-acetyltransferase domain-containing protein n=1 Tax=Streptomyces macrosporus TaxID=44032 RepID=A0ABN3JAR2_9ACTN